jgi:pyruvate dehydrogenase (quinone)
MELVLPPFIQAEPAFGMAMYLAKAALHGRAADVWQLVEENFL